MSHNVDNSREIELTQNTMSVAPTLHPEMHGLSSCRDRKFHYDAANDRCTNGERNGSYGKIL